MMEDSTFDLITELCSELMVGQICNNPSSKKSNIKKLRTQAYGTVLSSRCEDTEDDLENTPSFLLANILGRVYYKEKAKGQWTKDVMEHVVGLVDEAESYAENNPTFVAALKLLMSLGDKTPSMASVDHQELSVGLPMKILITDENYKHKPIIKSLSTVNPDIFEVPNSSSSGASQSLQVFEEKPGVGLKHHNFFIPSMPLSVDSRKFEEDVNNGNWFHSKLNSMMIPVNNPVMDPRSSQHQDEGYVTPDQDAIENQDTPYIPWEDLDGDFNLVYSWESFGSAEWVKEPKFISQRRDSVNPISRVIHAFDTTASRAVKSDLTPLKTISVEELEVAFKNLLVGVESTIFHYDHGRHSFFLQKGLCLKGSTANTLEEYCEDFIECGNRFRQLSKLTRNSEKSGLVYQMLCNNMKQYLQCYRGVVLKLPVMHSLLDTRDWLHKLSSQMQFLISLCPVASEQKSKDLLIYLCDKMPVHVRHDLSYVYYYVLQSCFTVYFTFLSKWIFKGVTDAMWEEEFFIKCNPLTEDMYNRKFWTEGFVLNKDLVPKCLKSLEDKLLLCGKSMALLKLCASEDPLCKQVKSQHPEITSCFNRVDLNRIEKKFELYKQKCKALCEELFGNPPPEPLNEDYYTMLMARTLDEIKGRQEEERRLKAQKKQFEFNVLKKEMEDAKARKIEERRVLLEKEQKLIEEAEKVDELNELRRQEERDKIIQLYSSLSEVADRRRALAEWKTKRAELYFKRRSFLNKEKEHLDEEMKSEKRKKQHDEDSKLQVAEKSLEKYLNTYNGILGSGDCVPRTASSEASTSSVQQDEGESKQEPWEKEGNVDEPECASNQPSEVNDDKRDWLIALDVAEQARQSALKFKQRNMHNDYNIITGVESTFEAKFGAMRTGETVEESILSDIINPSFKHNSLTEGIGDTANADVSESICDKNKRTVGEVQSVEGQSKTNQSSISYPNAPNKFEIPVSKPEGNTSMTNFMLNTSFSLAQTERLSVNQDIDMTSIHQNVKRSVEIPLLAQLELTADAILRLFNKHNLLSHMECIWKYFFLLEGEYARNLTKSLFEEAQKAPHPSDLLNVMTLNSLLRCAVGTNMDEEYTERLSFYVKEIPSVFRTLDTEMLDCLSLRYKTHWPINIIITDELIAKQDVIFKHLLKLHRVSWALEEMINLLKDKKLLNSPEYRQVQLFRHVMTHFITALKQYMTAVIIEQTWREFKKSFRNATNVDTMFKLYWSYIKNVTSKCLLGKVRVHTEHLLNSLFKEVLKFYEALRSGEWTLDSATGIFRHSNFSRMNHTFDGFQRMGTHLVHVFRKMSVSFPNIEQLATTLSLNDFYIVKDRK